MNGSYNADEPQASASGWLIAVIMLIELVCGILFDGCKFSSGDE